MYKLLIVSMDPMITSWKSLEAKRKSILAGLSNTKNGEWDVQIVYSTGIVPEVIAGRITHSWFSTFAGPYFERGYQHIYLHMSMAQWDELGLEAVLLGANQIDTDFVGECYGRSDEKTIRTKRRNLFIQNVLHEMSHELARATKTPDMTHAYHDASPDISGIFSSYDMAKWQLVYQAGMTKIASLKTIIANLLTRKEPTKLFHPVQWTPRIISQRYGEKNARYPRTKRHIGTDYAIPIGTPLHAPWDVEVTTAGTHASLGNYCHFTYTFQGEDLEERWCHLSKVPALGKKSRGAIVAYSGNSGDSTGPHLHREVWADDVRVDLINTVNWSWLTRDPEKLIY